MTEPSAAGAELPEPVRQLAARLGASGEPRLATVTLQQAGWLRGKPGGAALRFAASQVIGLRSPAFTWRARMGPLGCIAVVDALGHGSARLEARLFGALRLARAAESPALLKGETMRYLAELAWAPDAILLNRALAWRVVDGRTLRVRAGQGAAGGEVELRLDAAGRIAAIAAEDRPRQEGSGFVERPWRGRFFDYRQHQGRWIPEGGEVEWVLDGQAFTTWNGRILRWSLA